MKLTKRNVRLAWKYRGFLWKYRNLIRHRREICGVAAAATGAIALGIVALRRARPKNATMLAETA
jgi:hypothetical protein